MQLTKGNGVFEELLKGALFFLPDILSFTESKAHTGVGNFRTGRRIYLINGYSSALCGE